jgi:hypothetical protein
MAREPLAKGYPDLTDSLAERFTERVMTDAQLPPARRADVRDSCELWTSTDPPLVGVTCTITGSEHERPWDGSQAAAAALVDEAAESTAYLVRRTKYAWLRSRR